MPGPPPKHPSTRVRRNDPKKDFRVLSAGGRKGDPPAWPLGPDVLMAATLEHQRDQIANLQVELGQAEDGRTRSALKRKLGKLELASAHTALMIEMARDAEVALWDDLWVTPQAVLWEEAHAEREVAQYVRWKIRAEQGDLKAASEARQLSDRLGLNPLALLRLRAEVEHVEDLEDRGEQRRAKKAPAKKGRKKPPDDPRLTLVQ